MPHTGDAPELLQGMTHFIGLGPVTVGRQSHGFVSDFVPTQGVTRVAFGFVHATHQGAAIAGVDGDFANPALRVGGIHLGVESHADALAKVTRVIRAEMAVKLAQPRMAVQGRQGGGGGFHGPAHIR